MSKILVTGGTGIIGRHAVKDLQAQGHDVHVITRSGTGDKNLHQVDFLDEAGVSNLLDVLKPDTILHLAWETAHGTYWHSATNLDYLSATTKMAQKFAENGGKRFVGAGTCAEYSWSDEATENALKENTSQMLPHTLYGQAKLSIYQLLKRFFESNETSFSWGRLFLLYGPGEQQKRLCPDVILNLLAGQEVKCSSGNQIRDFMHSSDAGRAFSALATSSVEGAVNIATGAPIHLHEFTTEIGSQLGRPELIKLGALPDRPDDPPKIIPDVTRLKEEVGFSCKHTLESGLADTISWWQNNGDGNRK